MIEADRIAAEGIVKGVLLGRHLSNLETPADGVWDFHFAGVHLNVGSPWRIVDGISIRLGSCDHHQKFGLPNPTNAVSLAIELLSGSEIQHTSVSGKADLTVSMQNGYVLEVFNHSSGYEGWNLSSEGRSQVVALGGGDIAIFGS